MPLHVMPAGKRRHSPSAWANKLPILPAPDSCETDSTDFHRCTRNTRCETRFHNEVVSLALVPFPPDTPLSWTPEIGDCPAGPRTKEYTRLRPFFSSAGVYVSEWPARVESANRSRRKPNEDNGSNRNRVRHSGSDMGVASRQCFRGRGIGQAHTRPEQLPARFGSVPTRTRNDAT